MTETGRRTAHNPATTERNVCGRGTSRMTEKAAGACRPSHARPGCYFAPSVKRHGRSAASVELDHVGEQLYTIMPVMVYPLDSDK